MLLNALDFSDLQAALDAAGHGDRVHVPGTKPWQAPAGGFRIRKAIELFGDGSSNTATQEGTTLHPADGDTANGDVLVIEPDSDLASVTIRDLKIRNRPGFDPYDGRHGVSCVFQPARRIGLLRLERILVFGMSQNAFLLDGIDLGSGNTIALLSMSRCGASVCGGIGLVLRHVRMARVSGGSFVTNEKGGAFCERSGVILDGGTGLDGNATAVTAGQGQLLLTECSVAHVDSVHFEKFQSPVSVACHVAHARGATAIRGSGFAAGPTPAQSTMGVTVDSDSLAVVVFPNYMTRVVQVAPSSAPSMVAIDPAARGITVLPQFDYNIGITQHGSIGVSLSPNNGLFGVPLVRRPSQPGIPQDVAGMLMPSGPSDPAISVQDGALFYNTTTKQLRARVAGVWRTVSA